MCFLMVIDGAPAESQANLKTAAAGSTLTLPERTI